MAKVTRPYKDAPAEAATSITARLTPDGKCGEDTRFSRADRVMGKALYVRVQVDGSRKWVKVGTISRLHMWSEKKYDLDVCIDERFNVTWLNSDPYWKKGTKNF